MNDHNIVVSKDDCNKPCPVERGMRVVGGKWTGSLLWHLKDGPQRFNQLARQLNGASKKMIAQRLRELEENRLIRRRVISTKPFAVEYALEENGRKVLCILSHLEAWTVEAGL